MARPSDRLKGGSSDESGGRAAGVATAELPAAVPENTPDRIGEPASGQTRQDVEALAQKLGVAMLEDIRRHTASREFVESVAISYARRHAVIGLAGEAGAIDLAVCDLGGLRQVQAIGRLLAMIHPGRGIRPVFSPRQDILRAINSAYQQQSGQVQQVIDEVGGREVLDELEKFSGAGQAGSEDLLDVDGRSPVIKLVNLILFEAIKRKASDVHIQPYQDRLVVRMRIDGVLHDIFHPPLSVQDEIVSRVKVMGGMNIAERRLAQDGRSTVEVGDRVVDLRIATLPTSEGERTVIRLLDKSIRLYTLDELGMPANVLAAFRRVIHYDHGIILVTGPTGSGKTTTLYGALLELNSKELNILTLEDPIEYRLEGISQTQVNEKKGMTFAKGLRHVLRQDPDVIMVGEIRDEETASMAIQSALTGHLVFSTLHTNDACGAVARLLDLGVEPYLAASSVLGVLAQRLVRRICPNCAAPHEPTAEDLARWDLPKESVPEKSFAGKGCEHCLHTGYSGRVGVFELLEATEPIREEIIRRSRASSIKALAIKGGMTTLRADGLAKARAGRTTVDEVLRQTGRDDF